MVNNGLKKSSGNKIPGQILITQPKPESEKSPYFELERKYNIQLTFYPFYKVRTYTRPGVQETKNRYLQLFGCDFYKQKRH